MGTRDRDEPIEEATASGETPRSDTDSSDSPTAETPNSSRNRLASELPERVYAQLRQIAERRMAKERAGHTLGATALVHEAYLKLIRYGDLDWDGPGHFYVAASEAMRRILIDHARGRNRQKRSGGAKRSIRSVMDLAAPDASDEILALDEALERLETESPPIALIVRLRFYAGLTVEETADALGRSLRSVERDWATARRILHDALRGR